MGLSTGSLSHSLLGWVRNVVKEKKNLAKHELINYEASLSFAVLWALARTILPDEIITDFQTFLSEIGPRFRMDGNNTMATSAEGRGKFSINLESDNNNNEWEIHNAQLAPPTGVMAENYCR